MWLKIVLWFYVVLLCAGGYIGYRKAGSIISLITSVAFAIPLAICALGFLPLLVSQILAGTLGLFFLYRLLKSGKFMPAGLMAVLSLVVLLLLVAL